MGNSSKKQYENDPYLNNTNDYNKKISNFYQTNSSIVPITEQHNKESIEQMKENQKHTKTKSLQNTFIIKKCSIKFERDSVKENSFYITFEYIAYDDVYIQILYSSELLIEQKTIDCEFYSNKVLIEKNSPNYKSLLNQEFSLNSQQIESVLIKSNKSKNKCDVLIKIDNKEISTLLLFDFNWDNKGFPILKFKTHRLSIDGDWFDVHDVYGLSTEDVEEALCKICCSENKNTILLPCMHSYTCAECTIKLRMKDPKCPICRQGKLLNISTYIL